MGEKAEEDMERVEGEGAEAMEITDKGVVVP